MISSVAYNSISQIIYSWINNRGHRGTDKLKEEKPVTLPSDDVTFKKWG
jgi:hypothetical protein